MPAPHPTAAAPFLATAAKWNRGRFDRHEIRSAHTLRAAHWHLRTIADLIGPDTDTSTITRADLEVALELLHVSPRSANQIRSTLRQFFGWATDVAGICHRNPAAGLRNARTDRRRPRRVPARHVTAVLEHADLQGQTMLLIAAHLGLRRSEIAGLRVEDFDPAGRRLYIAAAKGLTERWVTVPDEAHRELSNYLAHLGTTTGPMWPSSHRPGHGLARGTFNRIVTDAGRRAGVKLWPHLLRHQALSDAAAAGATSHQLQRQSGHRYSSTLDAYVHLSMEDVAPAWEGRAYRAAAG